MPKHKMFFTVLILSAILLTSCQTNNKVSTSDTSTADNQSSIINNTEENKPMEDENMNQTMQNISMTIDDQTFIIEVYNNETTTAFIEQLPLAITMSDLNSNEKYYYLPTDLPVVSTISPKTIYEGELMCYSNNCLVLFYETFSTTFGGYVKIGKVENTSKLKDVLPAGDVEITFKIQ